VYRWQCTDSSGKVSQGAVYRWQCTGGRVRQEAVYRWQCTSGSVQVAVAESAKGQCTGGSAQVAESPKGQHTGVSPVSLSAKCHCRSVSQVSVYRCQPKGSVQVAMAVSTKGQCTGGNVQVATIGYLIFAISRYACSISALTCPNVGQSPSHFKRIF
jgi:LDH2 family malate/lactate/ureidoglycolate dehydrogenase